MFRNRFGRFSMWLCGFASLLGCVRLATAQSDANLNPPVATESWVDSFVQQRNLTVICFLGTECPLAKLYTPRLSRLSRDFDNQAVGFLGVFSNQQDSPAEIREFIESSQVEFPAGVDSENAIADRFTATRTPEVVLIDRKFRVLYRGAIDDQYQPGVARSKPKQLYLRQAIEETLNGQPVRLATTSPQGCLIGRRLKPLEQATVTYSNQVARVLQRHCIECHRDGEIGPFALTDYEEARGWAEMILEVVDSGRMPPWHATGQHEQFQNARLMPEADKSVLRAWLAQGTPLGDKSELPPAREFTRGWRLPRNPDRVIEMRAEPFAVPADGTVEYQYFVVDPGFTEDKWVTAAEIIPGNRRVVHHSIVFVRPPDGSDFRGAGWLAAYVPGQSVPPYTPSRGRFIPKGSKLVFQQHYTPVGKQQHDQTRLGLIFGNDPEVTHELFTVIGLNQEFEIPAGSENHVISTRLAELPKNGELLSFAPHMHYRGKGFELFVNRGGGRKQLIEVANYDFNWQHSYQLSTPIPLNDVDAFEFSFCFDNSTENPFNPDANRAVYWGDQTWEEMAVAFFDISRPRNPAPASAPSAATDSVSTATNQKRESRIRQFVDDFFRRFDRDGDGRIYRNELPNSLKHFGFRDLNSRRDGRADDFLDREEVRQAAAGKF